jgi:hypothetical protein
VENLVACELIRRSRDLAYVRTRSGLEVDFLAFPFQGDPQLVPEGIEMKPVWRWLLEG